MSPAVSTNMNTQRETWRHRVPFYYGWIVVAAAGWSALFTGPGQTYSYSIFIDSFIRDFGWSRTLVSSLYSAATLTSGLLMSVIGGLVDRWGARVMCVAAGLPVHPARSQPVLRIMYFEGQNFKLIAP